MKTISKSLPQLMAASLLMAGACTTSYAQTTGGGNNRPATSAGTRPAGALTDTAFISKNIMDNQMEIQLSQMGIDRGTDPMVKRTAQQMVTDHTQMLSDLTRIAGKHNMAIGTGSSMSARSAAGATGTGTTGTTGMGNTTQGTSGAAGTTGSGTSGIGTGTGTTTPPTSDAGTATTGPGNTRSSGTIGSNSTGTGTTGSGNAGASGTTGSGSAGMGTTTGTGSTGTTGMGTAAPGAGMQDPMGMAMHDMTPLQNATGAEFDRMWVSQMLSMHEAKLTELTAAAATITDRDLKAAVTGAIPKIRMHRDMLAKMNLGSGKNNSANRQQ